MFMIDNQKRCLTCGLGIDDDHNYCPTCAPKPYVPAFSNLMTVETCPDCGVRFVTTQAGPFVCPDCLAEQVGYEADRADNARPYLN